MSAGIKRQAELFIASYLKAQLPQFTFYTSEGGSDEPTPLWTPGTAYAVADVIRPNNPAFIHAVVVTHAGLSGSSEPAFTDTIGEIITETASALTYQTLTELAIPAETDAASPEPPFGVAVIEDSTDEFENVWLMKGKVMWVTSIDREDPENSSKEAHQVYHALQGITATYDPIHKLTIHGFDLQGSESFTDGDHQARGDSALFVLGASEAVIS